MITANLQGIAQAVLARAQQQGSVTPEEVQEELTRGGIPYEMWQEVLTLCRRSLRRRQGRFHYIQAENPPTKPSKPQSIPRMVRRFIRRYKQTQRVERREQNRIEVVLPVRLLTEDHRELHLLSRDLSPTGLRLIGTAQFAWPEGARRSWRGKRGLYADRAHPLDLHGWRQPVRKRRNVPGG